MFDLVIRNGVIVDGTGQPRFLGDIGIKGQRITAVARRPQTLAGTVDAAPLGGSDYAGPVIDATGKVVAPGFFDIHSHSDRTILANRRAESSLSQGITTVIGGNCGGSAAPLNPRMKDRLAQRARFMPEAPQIERDWETVGEFLAKVEGEDGGIGINFGMFVGQGTVRDFAMGHDDRSPTDEEMAVMRGAVERAMHDGCRGLSTGRSYMPGRQAQTEEVIELAKVAAVPQGLYCTHMRSEGNGIFEALEEAFRIGREGGLPVEIVHLKVSGKPNWGKAPRVLRMIEEARESGLDVLFDVYPYEYSQVGLLRGAMGLRDVVAAADQPAVGQPTSASTTSTSPEALEARVIAELPRLLADPWRRSSLPNSGIWWCPKTPQYNMKSLSEVAGAMGLVELDAKGNPPAPGTEPAVFFEGLLRAAARLLAANDGVVKTAGLMNEDEVRLIIRHPLGMFGTDASATDGSRDPLGATHPRTYGTYPRILGKYVRDEGILPLEQAIMKMTSLPARRAGVTDRGTIAAGQFADVTVFDPQTIAETATPENPAARSTGVEYVLVNGRLAYRRGTFTDVRSGKVLRF